MEFFLFNSLTKKKELFEPIDENLVKLYVCGPTVYDLLHIGNGRCMVVFDVLYRILIWIYGKNNVRYVRNITDVDDKIIENAHRNNTNVLDLARKMSSEFFNDMRYLKCLSPDVEPRVVDHISEIILMITRLVDRGYAYISNNHVYFSINKFRDYGKFCGIKIEELLDGVRIKNQEGKHNAHDFVLWKPPSELDSKESVFDSPFGVGRPGWHIECSAMSHKYLGENFDIHGGGIDLIFPHHTNEIAQSVCSFDDSFFAKFFVHSGMLTVNNEKMSKSLRNFVTIHHLREAQKVNGDVLRIFLLSAHYSNTLNYNSKSLDDAGKMLNYWSSAIKNSGISIDHREDYGNSYDLQVPYDFYQLLLNDMNTPLAIAKLNEYARGVFIEEDIVKKTKIAKNLLDALEFLGISCTSSLYYQQDDKQNMNGQINRLINERNKARLDKNWSASDSIRKQLLLEFNVEIQDEKDGSTSWFYKNNY